MARISKRKTAVLTLRIEPRIKNAAEEAAGQEHRSLTNLIEALVIDHCRRKHIPIERSVHAREKK